MKYFHFLSGRLFFSLAFTPPQFPRDAKPHNSCIRPGNPSPGGRVKSLCLRPLPPADPAPARPLRGICLGGGRGWFPAWEQTPEPAFPLLPWEGLPHLSRSPLLPPTAAGEHSCLRVLAGTSDRPRRPGARGSRLSSADPEEHTSRRGQWRGARRGHYRRRARTARLPGPPALQGGGVATVGC